MTLTTEDQARQLRILLADRLEATGHLPDPEWRRAFEAVPRHAFVPKFWTLVDGHMRQITAGDPEWLETAYQDSALATQLTDGVATSSSTAPGLMLDMLHALDVADGMRVLEIATGTGYNAALLAERLGSGNVVTVEVDPDLAWLAEVRLHTCGYAPTVLAGDGRAGQAGAPFDRLIATCGFSRVPRAWLGQVRPGGVIVCPVGWGIVRLIVSGDGATEGRFLPTGSYFMAVRDAGATGTATHPGRPNGAEQRLVTLDLGAVAGDERFRFLISLVAPNISLSTERDETGVFTAVELWAADGSWARVEHGTAWQAGPRRLWDVVETAHEVYEQHGRPGRERFGMTVTPDIQEVWLDSPDGPCWVLSS